MTKLTHSFRLDASMTVRILNSEMTMMILISINRRSLPLIVGEYIAVVALRYGNAALQLPRLAPTALGFFSFPARQFLGAT